MVDYYEQVVGSPPPPPPPPPPPDRNQVLNAFQTGQNPGRLSEIRRAFPEYDDMPDEDLAATLYKGFYESRGVSRPQFNRGIELYGPPSEQPQLTDMRNYFPEYSDMSDRDLTRLMWKAGAESQGVPLSEFALNFGLENQGEFEARINQLRQGIVGVPAIAVTGLGAAVDAFDAAVDTRKGALEMMAALAPQQVGLTEGFFDDKTTIEIAGKSAEEINEYFHGVLQPNQISYLQRYHDLKVEVGRRAAETSQTTQAGQQMMEWSREEFPVSAAYEDIWGDIIRGIGSTGGFFLSAVINPAAAVITAMAAGSGEAYDRALRDTADADDMSIAEILATNDRQIAALLGAGPGALDVIPVFEAMHRFANPATRAWITRFVLGALKTGFIEGNQEGTQEFLQNVVAKVTHDPEASLWAGVPEAALVGFGAGVPFGAVSGGLSRRAVPPPWEGGVPVGDETRFEAEPRTWEGGTDGGESSIPAEPVAPGPGEPGPAPAPEPTEETEAAPRPIPPPRGEEPPPEEEAAPAAPGQDLRAALDAMLKPTAGAEPVTIQQASDNLAGTRVHGVEPGGAEFSGTVKEIYEMDSGRVGITIETEDDELITDLAYYDSLTIQAPASPERPAIVTSPEDLDDAGDRVGQPTAGQADAGNYPHGHIVFQGLDIAIETPRGGLRQGFDEDGNVTWEVPDFPAHYGRIKRTDGADGDQVDAYLGRAVDSDRVFVLDQVDPESRAFDEHKVFLGYRTERDAMADYQAAFTDGSALGRMGAVTEMSMGEFKDWLASSDTTKPLAYEEPRADQPEPEPPTERSEEPARRPEPEPTEEGAAAPVEEPTEEPAAPEPPEDVGAPESWSVTVAVPPVPEFDDAGNKITRARVGLRDGRDINVTITSDPDELLGNAEIRRRARAEAARQLGIGIAEPEPVEQPEPEAPPPPELSDEERQRLYGTVDAPNIHNIARVFGGMMARGAHFPTITAARKAISDEVGFPILSNMPQSKLIDEAMEIGVVQAAREIIARERAAGALDEAIYDQLVDLYNRQPILKERTATSMLNQAYSTPVPLAWLASHLALVHPEYTKVFEPTAGNASLLIGAAPENVVANEIQPTRAEVLRRAGVGTVTELDATELPDMGRVFDAVLANPPFGKVWGNGRRKNYRVPWGTTTEVDQAIVAKTLESALRDTGRAVLLLGGTGVANKTGQNTRKAYQDRNKLPFFAWLYDNYNVVDQFTVSGELYRRQGAEWPIDVVVIEGRGPSGLQRPDEAPPPIYTTFEQLREGFYGKRMGVGARRAGADDGVQRPPVQEPGEREGVAGTPPVPPPGPGDVGVGEGSPGPGGPVSPGPVPGPGEAEQPGGDVTGVRPDTGPAEPGMPGGPVAPPAEPGPAGGPEEPVGPEPGGVAGGAGPSIDEQIAELSDEEFENLLDEALGEESNPPPKPKAETKQGGARAPRGPRPKAEPNPLAEGGLTADDWAFFQENFGKGDEAYSTGADLQEIDEKLYAQAKPRFQKFWDTIRRKYERVIDAVRAMKAHFEALLGDKIKPYLSRFFREVYGRPEPKPAPKEKPAAPPMSKDVAAEGQVEYVPRSWQGRKDRYRVGTLVPANMANALRKAFDKLEAELGITIDEFVAGELGYKDAAEMWDARHFSTEQVDAIALALNNMKNGSGFILGDQTGIGKGRVVAAIIKWASNQGKVPIFMTEKTGLYDDMYRDLHDIGWDNFNAAFTNTDLRGNKGIPLTDLTGRLEGYTKSEYQRVFRETVRTGKLPDNVDAIFTTYDQVNLGKNGYKYLRHEVIEALGANSILIMDEAHNALGTEETMPKLDEDGNVIPRRSEWMREVIDLSMEGGNGVLYSSATYAKRPGQMDLYRSTDMRHAVDRIQDLGSVIAQGGDPLAQFNAAMLVEQGQYIRRERSFKGIDMPVRNVPISMETADKMAGFFGRILQFQDTIEEARDNWITDTASNIADIHVAEGDTMTAEGSNFASVMHNLVGQMLMASKLESAMDEAVEAHKRGEKPIMVVSNTFASFHRAYMDANDIQMGAHAGNDFQFNRLFKTYLRNTLRASFGTRRRGTQRQIWMTLEELALYGDQSMVDEYHEIEKLIEDTDLSLLSASPIDRMIQRFKAAGIRVGEITGRNFVVDFDEGGKIKTRESGPAVNKKIMTSFNNGDLDALVLNRSGSAGYSMHATAENDGKPRHMMILQPEADIAVFVQVLGRIFRTGQIKNPIYTIMGSELPAEVRPTALMLRKLASMSANTTANEDSPFATADVVDFINKVGDDVVAQYLSEDTDLGDALALGGAVDQDIARKASGRMAALPVARQKEMLAEIDRRYTEEIKRLDDLGENPLIPATWDLDARVLESRDVTENKGPSIFEAPAVASKMDVKRIIKPYTGEQVRGIAYENAVGEKADAAELSDKGVATAGQIHASKLADQIRLTAGERITELEEAFRATDEAAVEAQSELDQAEAEYDDARKMVETTQEIPAEIRSRRRTAQKNFERIGRRLRVIATQLENFQDIRDKAPELVEKFPIFSPIEIVSGQGENRRAYAGVVTNWTIREGAKNPIAPSNIQMTMALVQGDSKSVTFPFSKLRTETYAVSRSDAGIAKMLDAMEANQMVTREEREIITGNLLAGYARFRTGTMAWFTDAEGDFQQGIVMPRGLDLADLEKKLPVQFKTADQVIRFLDATSNSMVRGADVLGISKDQSGAYTFRAKSGPGGKVYALNQKANAALRRDRGEFQLIRKQRAYVAKTSDPAIAREVVDAFMTRLRDEGLGAPLEVTSFKDEARRIIGLDAEKAATQDEQYSAPLAMTPEFSRQFDDVVAEVVKIAKTVNPNVDVRVVEELFGEGPALLHSGATTDTRQPIAGSYSSGRNLIQISLNPTFDPNDTAYHEAWHSLETLLTEDEQKILRDRFPGVNEITHEEHTAIAFAEWARKSNGAQPAAVKRAFAKIRNFLQRLGNLLKGRGFKSVESIFTAGKRGQIAGRLSDTKAVKDQFIRDYNERYGDNPDMPPADAAYSVTRNALNKMMAALPKGRAKPAPGITVTEKVSTRDLTPMHRWLWLPQMAVQPGSGKRRKPRVTDAQRKDIAKDVFGYGVGQEIEMSRVHERLQQRWTDITKKLSRKQFKELSALLWVGDANQIEWETEAELTSALKAEGLDVDPKVIKAYFQTRKLIHALGRMIDNHRRAMLPSWRNDRDRLLTRAANMRVMDDSQFRRLYFRRARIRQQINRGNMGAAKLSTLLAEADRIEKELHDIRKETDLYKDLLSQADAIEAKLNALSIRNRIKGYLPHRFLGNWRVQRLVGKDDKGNEIWEHVISSDEGFHRDVDDAVRAANAVKAENPDYELRVIPVEFKFPGRTATELSDKAYQRFVAHIAKHFELKGQALYEAANAAARKRYRWRIAPFLHQRTGTPGYLKDLERVMRMHIGSVSRYVYLDKIKYRTIETMERLGLSRNARGPAEGQQELITMVENWLRDVQGNPTKMERRFNEMIDRHSALSSAMVPAGIVFLGGVAWGGPTLGLLAGSYVGATVYRAIKRSGPFPTRAITGAFMNHMAHLKLGAFINLASAGMNLTQTAINTYPILGERWTAAGIKMTGDAVVDMVLGKDSRYLTMLKREDIAPVYSPTETTPHMMKKPSLVSRYSMLFFQSAEQFNRSVAFLGAYARAEKAGKTHGQALREARAVIQRTQFHYGPADKPEAIRGTFLRVPGQFKNFMFHQIAFVSGLRGAEIPRFVAALALVTGVFGLPGFEILDWLLQLLTSSFDEDDEEGKAGFSIINWLQEIGLDWQAKGELDGSVWGVLMRGLPALMNIDMSTRAGMGIKFLPSTFEDLMGPWVGTIQQVASLADKNAEIVDYLKALSPGIGSPLKMIEAAADGYFEHFPGDFFDPDFYDRLHNGQATLTSPWYDGKTEMTHVTSGELWAKAFGFSLLRESRLRDLRQIMADELAGKTDAQQVFKEEIIDVLRAYADEPDRMNQEIDRIVRKSIDAGVPLTERQVKGLVEGVELDRGERAIARAPRERREQYQQWYEGINR